MDVETKETILRWSGTSLALTAGVAFALPFVLIAAGLAFS